MKLKTLTNVLIPLFLAIPVLVHPQHSDFNQRLQAYVDELVGDLAKESIYRERFLVQQIRMINEEIKSRVGNPTEIRRQYFDRLQERLAEIKELKARLGRSGSRALDGFIKELENRIKQTINAGVVDFKRQKVIEDAVQLLYLAEEMIKLDPGSSLEDDPRISTGLSKAQSGFLQSFGQESSYRPRSAASTVEEPATIFDVYEEWRTTERLKYQLRWTDIQIIKNRLIRNATSLEKMRMFRRELRQAAEAFNYGYYDLSERSFAEIQKRYSDMGTLDDVIFYRAESNFIMGRYNHAEKGFNKLMTEAPSSVYLPTAYKRLMFIDMHFEEYESVLENFRRMQAVVASNDPNYDEARFLAAVAGLKGGYFGDAVSHASEIPPSSEYYFQGRYVLAEALAGGQNLQEAVSTFTSLISGTAVDPEMRFNILLKLGYIAYEMGNPQAAIRYFDQIASTFSRYDRVLIGYGWAHYKIEIDKELIDQRDLTAAKKYLELLLDLFPNSDYYLEARTLLGYVNQLELNPNAALRNFEYAFAMRDVKELSDDMNAERDRIRGMLDETEKLERKALKNNNPAAYERVKQLKSNLEKPMVELSYSDLSSVGVAAGSEISKLKNQINELDQLKKIAAEKGDKQIVKRIETMQLRIYRAINEYPVYNRSALGVNYFDEHPLARKESVVENQNSKVLQMREESRQEREKILQHIARLDVEISNARLRKDYTKLVRLELQRDRFNDLLKKFDYLESWTYSLDVRQTNINLARWSDYGAFGMANVNFAIRNLQREQATQMLDQINEINNAILERKENLEHIIAQIEDEITLMTRRVRRQERIREREELERQFEESYFDTHQSELEQQRVPDTTLPPQMEEEE